MCLTIRLTILASSTEIKLMLYSQFTVSALMWSAKAYIYLRISLVLLTVLCMYIIYPSVESEDMSG